MVELRKLMVGAIWSVCGLLIGLPQSVSAADRVALDEAQIPVSERFETNFSHTMIAVFI